MNSVARRLLPVRAATVQVVREKVDEELRDLDDLTGEEAAVLALLRERLAEEAA